MAEHERSYQPGDRKAVKHGAGRISDGRAAWVNTEAGQFVILTQEPTESQAGQSIRMFHPYPGKSTGITWDLTKLTEAELLAVREIWNAAFDWALPICQQRDKDAQDAFEQGDDSHARVYRRLPTLVYRTRPSGEHGQGVQHGPEDAPGVGEGANPGHGDGVRGDGDGLAEPDPPRVKPQDNWPTVNQPPELR